MEPLPPPETRQTGPLRTFRQFKALVEGEWKGTVENGVNSDYISIKVSLANVTKERLLEEMTMTDGLLKELFIFDDAANYCILVMHAQLEDMGS